MYDHKMPEPGAIACTHSPPDYADVIKQTRPIFVKTPVTDLFCAGHSFLADGTLLIAGGTRAWYAPPTEKEPCYDKNKRGARYEGLRDAFH